MVLRKWESRSPPFLRSPFRTGADSFFVGFWGREIVTIVIIVTIVAIFRERLIYLAAFFVKGRFLSKVLLECKIVLIFAIIINE